MGALISILNPEINFLKAGILRRKKAGHSVDVADHGEIAVNLARENSYDVILMDIQMPVMDGFEATRRIREFLPEIPIIALTAYAMQQDRERILSSGFNYYLTKPVQRNRLLETILRACESSLSSGNSKISRPAEQVPTHSQDVDFSNLEEDFGEEIGFMEEILTTWLQSSEEFMAELTDSPNRSNPNAVARVLHSLKGISGAIGAMPLFELCGELENEAREGRMDSVLEKLGELQARVQAVKESVENYLGTHHEKSDI